MSLHKEPQKHIGTSIPSGAGSLTLFHGISLDPEEDIVHRCGGCAVRLRASGECPVGWRLYHADICTEFRSSHSIACCASNVVRGSD